MDSSAEMIRTAREKFPQGDWQEGDISSWLAREAADLIFSNAALNWVSDHARVIPHLFAQVAPGGALAWQVPANIDAPAHALMRKVAASAVWSAHFPETVRKWFVHEPSFYYDLLAPQAARVDIWLTDYLHVMESPAAIVEWYKGTGLRPFLEKLAASADQERFLADYLAEIEAVYSPQPDGRVLFPSAGCSSSPSADRSRFVAGEGFVKTVRLERISPWNFKCVAKTTFYSVARRSTATG